MKKTIFILGLSGLVFAGYLSAIKLFNEKCAFNEACPYFLGYPACYYGFVMYLAIAVLAGLLVLGKWDERKAIHNFDCRFTRSYFRGIFYCRRTAGAFRGGLLLLRARIADLRARSDILYRNFYIGADSLSADRK